ncbi:MAG: IS1380 family transposase [Planctomycetes bacterium]|nr:IS1380 family transposase [Planctomycetota bacterium]
MTTKLQRRIAEGKRRIERRLDKNDKRGFEEPMFTASNIHYEIAERVRGMAHGGIGAIHLLARRIGLIDAIDNGLHVLKIHLPYHESDHVLNLAYNALCDGTCLQDLELRRNDEVFLDALGARRIPDPTTAGDFCRRFTAQHVHSLIDIINDVRQHVWARQADDFFDQAIIDMDGVVLGTDAECKAGIDIAYNGVWGYHPLVVSLANTAEVFSVINRPGNRPSHEGAAAEADRAMRVCFAGGFRSVLLRGDTDFSQTTHLDRWAADPRVRFIFGMDAMPNLQVLADFLPSAAWRPLKRPARYQVKTRRRRRPRRVKDKIVREREFKNIRLDGEKVAEFRYRPSACKQDYRMIVVRKNLSVEKGEQRLYDDYRYFFYLTNDWHSTPAEIVFGANKRCNQENLHAQLRDLRALHAPVDTLESNWAYMVMTALAWNLKAWWALWPEDRPGPHAERYRQEKQTMLRMEFKTFVNAIMRLPCQLVRAGRRLIYRLTSWTPWQGTFFRMLDQLRCCR